MITLGTYKKPADQFDLDVESMIDQNTLAWRAMIARESKGLKQTELVEIMNTRYGISLTVGGYSKIETGDTKAPRHEILIAMKHILGISLDELIEGVKEDEPEENDVFMTEEANRIGVMVDQLPPEVRVAAEESTRTLYDLSQKVRMSETDLTEREDQIIQYQKEVAVLRNQIAQLRQQVRQNKSAPHDLDSL